MGCAAAIVDVSYESSYGPTLITNNDGGTEVSMPSKSGGTFSPLVSATDMRLLPLAGFLRDTSSGGAQHVAGCLFDGHGRGQLLRCASQPSEGPSFLRRGGCD